MKSLPADERCGILYDTLERQTAGKPPMSAMLPEHTPPNEQFAEDYLTWLAITSEEAEDDFDDDWDEDFDDEDLEEGLEAGEDEPPPENLYREALCRCGSGKKFVECCM